jgi:serine protein kinase
MIKNLFKDVQNENKNEIMSFEEFFQDLEKNPKIHLKNSAIYLKEVFDYYGKDENGFFNIFLKKDDELNNVYGNKKIQRLIYNSINNFIEQGFNNKFILLAGPNGSAKTTLIKKIMKACEEYSLTDEGSLYTFSWIFPVSRNTFLSGTSQVGLNPEKYNNTDTTSFAYLKESDISAVVASELKDNPILLIPKKIRQELINQVLKDDVDYLNKIKKTYLYKGDLSIRNKDIFDALLKDYNGNYEEVLRHIRVEKYNISKRYSRSAVTIEPQMHVDAKMQQITMDRRIQNLPPSIQSLNLFQTSGELISANRGILEYSDLLKRPLDTFKYLLMTIETKNINMQGILTELDILFMGSSNEIHYHAFKQHPDYKSFKARFKVIHVPYLSNFKEEEKIYKDHLLEVKNYSKFEPHSLSAFAMWNVMTRLHEPNKTKNINYKNEVEKILLKVNSLEKALIYAGEFSELNDKYSQEELREIKNITQNLKREWANDEIYEGRFGMSPRESKEILFDLINSNKMISYIEILEHVAKLEKKKIYGEHEATIVEQLEQNQGNNSFKDNNVRIELLRDFFDKKFDNELRDSLGLVDSLAYEDYIKRYINAVNAHLKGEKVLNKITKKYEDVDQNFLMEFEEKMGVTKYAEDYRTDILNKVGAFSLDNPDKKIVYSEIFKETIYKKLRENFIESQKETIKKLMTYLEYYSLDEKKSSLEKEKKEFVDKVLNNLHDKYNYSKEVALYLIKENYGA